MLEQIKVDINAVEIDMVLENSKKIIDLINDIDDGVIAKDVLKYISNYLKFNGTSLKSIYWSFLAFIKDLFVYYAMYL